MILCLRVCVENVTVMICIWRLVSRVPLVNRRVVWLLLIRPVPVLLLLYPVLLRLVPLLFFPVLLRLVVFLVPVPLLLFPVLFRLVPLLLFPVFSVW